METAKKTPIYNLVILDKSGSMEAIRTEAINGYNETLGSIKANTSWPWPCTWPRHLWYHKEKDLSLIYMILIIFST